VVKKKGFAEHLFGVGLGKLEGFKKSFFNSTFVIIFSFSGNRAQPLKHALST
jgi:hypothetical protein